LSGITSTTAIVIVIIACRSITFASKGAKYALSLTNPQKKKYSGVSASWSSQFPDLHLQL
jgi:hypothetical protein